MKILSLIPRRWKTYFSFSRNSSFGFEFRSSCTSLQNPIVLFSVDIQRLFFRRLRRHGCLRLRLIGSGRRLHLNRLQLTGIAGNHLNNTRSVLSRFWRQTLTIITEPFWPDDCIFVGVDSWTICWPLPPSWRAPAGMVIVWGCWLLCTLLNWRTKSTLIREWKQRCEHVYFDHQLERIASSVGSDVVRHFGEWSVVHRRFEGFVLEWNSRWARSSFSEWSRRNSEGQEWEPSPRIAQRPAVRRDCFVVASSRCYLRLWHFHLCWTKWFVEQSKWNPHRCGKRETTTVDYL